MTTQDARERAWQDFKAEIEADYSYPLPFGFEQTWTRAWDAAKREDEQRIAALVAAAQRMNAVLWRFDLVGFDYTAEYEDAAKGLHDALRALAGQLPAASVEEVPNAS